MSSFIGCKISLVSKAQIRYEGVLYTIDPQESTVALSRVKSFGTEDRKVERVIPARDEIYEYIIFRGSDIEDLNVCEHNKERSLLSEDSAIVKAEASISDNYIQGNVPHGGLPKNIIQGDNHSSNWKTSDKRSPIGNKSLSNGTRPAQSKDETNFKQKINQPVGTIKQSHPNNEYKKSQTKKQESYNNGHSDNKHEHSKPKVEYRKTQEKYDTNYYNYDYDYHYDNDYKYQGSNYGGAAEYTSNSYERASCGRNRRSDYRADEYYCGESNKVRGFESGEYNGDYCRGLYYGYKSVRESREHYYERGSNKPRRGSNNRDNTKQKEPSFKEDYDFESANAIIAVELANMHVCEDKKEVKEDTEAVNEEGDLMEEAEAAYYDKNKSFFDKISSEMIDRANGKVVRAMNRKDERKINVETFGVAEAGRSNGKWLNCRGGGGGRFNGRSRGYSYVDAAYRGSCVGDYKRDLPSHKSSGRGHHNGRRFVGSNGGGRDDFR